MSGFLHGVEKTCKIRQQEFVSVEKDSRVWLSMRWGNTIRAAFITGMTVGLSGYCWNLTCGQRKEAVPNSRYT